MPLLSACLMGCIGDDYSACVRNCALYFDYPDFPEHIGRVNVGIYDADGLLVTSHQVDAHALSVFQGIQLDLTGGSYVAVCWANAFDNTSLHGLTPGASFDDGRVHHPNLSVSAPIASHDSLYYGKLSFVIPEDAPKGVQEDTVAFVPAHITLKIHVKGLSNTAPGTPAEDYPLVRTNHLLASYDFDMQPLGDATSYHPLLQVDPTEKLVAAHTHVLRFDNETPATIDVVENAASQKILYSLGLRDFMQANGITVVHGEKLTLPIFITFHDGHVEVSLEGWGGTPVEPEI